MAKGVSHKINIGDNFPFKSKAIRRSKAAEAIFEEEIQKLLNTSLLVESHSPWASPLLIIKKNARVNRVVIN